MAQNPRLSVFSFVDFEWKTILTALLLYGRVQFLQHTKDTKLRKLVTLPLNKTNNHLKTIPFKMSIC